MALLTGLLLLLYLLLHGCWRDSQFAVRFLSLVRPFMSVLPEVAAPERKGEGEREGQGVR